jgi:hypothetical protein
MGIRHPGRRRGKVRLVSRLGLEGLGLGNRGRSVALGPWPWGGLVIGASFGLIVAPPVLIAPPVIYAAPPPIVVALPAIAPPPIAAGPPPGVAAAPARPGALPVGPPPVIVAPPAFALIIAPPALVFADIGPVFFTHGFITGGFVGFHHTAFSGFGYRRAYFGAVSGRGRWARDGGGHGGHGWRGGGGWGWRGSGYGGGHQAGWGFGGWHDARGGPGRGR